MIINLYEYLDGWFLQRLAEAIRSYVGKTFAIRPVPFNKPVFFPNGVNFFCTMDMYREYLKRTLKRPSKRDIIMTTHIEKWHPWDISYKRPYYMPVNLIAFCRKWYDFFVQRKIYPIGVATPGIEKEFFLINHEQKKHDKPLVALISRLYASGRKGEEWLKPVFKKIGHDFRWIIIGDGWDNVLDPGFFNKYDVIYRRNANRPEYYALMRSIDIFLSLSKIEGGPMPMIESMASGVVPVVSDTGFAEEIIVNGENGFVYPVGRVDRICDILRSLKHEDLCKYREKMRRFVEKYTWENYAEKISAMIEKVHREYFG